MKETLYTIPLIDAFSAADECPFCFIERKLEQEAIAFILGSAYMESDIREATDEAGFCRHHMKMMYDYGNSLGNALMLKTHYQKLNAELNGLLDSYKPGRTSLKDRLKKTDAPMDPVSSWIRHKESTCYVCDYFKDTYKRYVDTFFHLFKTNPDFIGLLKGGKGFCLHHFADLMEASRVLSPEEKSRFVSLVFPLIKDNLKRLEQDVSWFADKFDYRNKDADWKNSRDAIPRGMQKINGGYPADPPFKENL